MTRVEQHKIIETLQDYRHKMNNRERDDFEMFQKRDRDDEELDELSRRKLIEMYEKYIPERFRS